MLMVLKGIFLFSHLDSEQLFFVVVGSCCFRHNNNKESSIVDGLLWLASFIFKITYRKEGKDVCISKHIAQLSYPI